MKRLKYLLIVVSMTILTACNLEELMSLVDSSDKEVVENNSTEEVTENSNGTNESESINEKTLLEESFLAMQQVTNLHMTTELNIVEQHEGEERTGYRTFDVEMLLEEPFSQHYMIHIDDNIAEQFVSGEVYEVGEKEYFHSSLNKVEWEYFDNASTVEQLAEEIKKKEVAEYLSLSDQFEIMDESENQYVLTFNGDFEEVENIFYSGAMDMFEKVQKSMSPSGTNLDVSEFNFKMIIDKETSFVKGYEMLMKLHSTESDDYVFEANYVITFDSFNEYGQIEVPQKVIDAAANVTEEEGDINPVRSELPMDLPMDFPLPGPIKIDYYEEYTDDSEYYIIINFFFDEADFGDGEYKDLISDYTEYTEKMDYKISQINELEHKQGDLLSFIALLPQSEVNDRNHFAINMFSEGSMDKAEDSAFGRIHWRIDK